MDILDNKLFESIRMDISGSLVSSESNFGHFGLSSIPSPHSIVDTSWPSPTALQFVWIIV